MVYHVYRVGCVGHVAFARTSRPRYPVSLQHGGCPLNRAITCMPRFADALVGPTLSQSRTCPPHVGEVRLLILLASCWQPPRDTLDQNKLRDGT